MKKLIFLFLFATMQIFAQAQCNVNINAYGVIGCGTSISVSLSAYCTGGIAPYSYQWSNIGTNNTATAYQAGTYTVTITDAAGCS